MKIPQKEQYPIGHFQNKKSIVQKDIAQWIFEIKELPKKLTETVFSLTEDQLDTPYRKGGWTLRQLVHHIADSHLNGYSRMKLTLTEDQPTLKTYNQELWSKLPDSKHSIEPSLTIIKGLHERWVYVLKSLDENQLNRECIHPESGRLVLKSLIGLYAWHGNHHLAHITNLKEHQNWN